MKRNSLIILVFLVCSLLANAQEVDYNKIIYPDSVEVPNFEERLVQLAWKNTPSNRSYEKEVYVATKMLREQQLGWADNLKASFNLNEGNINPGENVNIFFPRYNFNLTLPLGMFISTPIKSKQARGNMEIAGHELNQRKLAIRAETLRRYQNYLTQVELLNLRAEAVENLWSSYLVVEENYENGRATLTDYNVALHAYNKAKEEKILQEGDLYTARIALEELIGIPLNSLR